MKLKDKVAIVTGHLGKGQTIYVSVALTQTIEQTQDISKGRSAVYQKQLFRNLVNLLDGDTTAFDL